MNMDEASQTTATSERPGPGMLHSTHSTRYRRSDFDVTNTVQVSSAESVRHAVQALFAEAWPQAALAALDRAFVDFEQLYNGRFPGYLGCDTVYHDVQHSLDGTLAAARLVVAHERTCEPERRLGAERAAVAVIVALYHDAGYIRQIDDHSHANGAELTQSHVSRSAEFLRRYLPTLDLAAWADIAAQMVHFTGYERKFAEIDLSNPLDRIAGHLIGTGDLIAQMSDRCYLEKCRDRLYPEFVLGGIALPDSASDHHGTPQDNNGESSAALGGARYRSGLDVLRHTPEFIAETRRTRLDGEFAGAYRTLASLFGGRNPYMEAIDRNLEYLGEVLRTGNWLMLRRDPPCFTWEQDPLQKVRELMSRYLRRVSSHR
jgi:hypothetical protein